MVTTALSYHKLEKCPKKYNFVQTSLKLRLKPRPRVILAIAAIQFQYLKLWLYPETFCNNFQPFCSFS